MVGLLVIAPNCVNQVRLDERNPPPFGRVGDPDDIVATVRITDGQVRETHLVVYASVLKSRIG